MVHLESTKDVFEIRSTPSFAHQPHPAAQCDKQSPVPAAQGNVLRIADVSTLAPLDGSGAACAAGRPPASSRQSSQDELAPRAPEHAAPAAATQVPGSPDRQAAESAAEQASTVTGLQGERLTSRTLALHTAYTALDGASRVQDCRLALEECPVLNCPFATSRCVALVPCGHVLSIKCARPPGTALLVADSLCFHDFQARGSRLHIAT
jgi:hypothetical protein